MLLSHEVRLEMSKGKTHSDVMHDMSANHVQKGQNYGRPNIGNNNDNIAVVGGSGGNSSGEKDVCQMCFIPRHVGYKRKNRFNYGYVTKQARSGFRPRADQSFGGNYGRNYNNYGRRYNGFGYGRGFNSGFPRNSPF